MSDPLRMLDTNVPSHIRLLLEAGRDAEPHASLVETTLQSLRAADLAAAPSSLSPLTSSMVIPALAGMLSLGALVGLTWMMVAPAEPRGLTPSSLATTPADEEPAGAAAATSDSRSEPLAQAGPDPAQSAQPGAAPRAPSGAAPSKHRSPSAAVVQSATSVSPDDARQRSRSSTMAQRDLVLRARAALDGGAPQRALTILSGYETSFDELRFIPEVLSLRMQAHQRMGNVEASRQLARRIIAMYPRSSQAGLARQLLGAGGTLQPAK